MKAIVQDRFGSAEVLQLREIEKPVPDEGSVLLRVEAASVNALDWRFMRGDPFIARLFFGFGFLRPKKPVRGADVAGRVESVGARVTRFKPGDEVFGVGDGSFAEFVAADETELERKPPSLTFARAAALPVAGVTALQGLRDHARVKPGQSVLVYGAGGGVGTFAVQIAKALGAHVTAVTSPKHVDRIRSLGADSVVDYTREDVTRGDARYDVIVDISGTRSFTSLRRALTPVGKVVLVGGAGAGRVLKAAVLRLILRYPVVFFVGKVRPTDLAELARLVEAGKLAPVISREVPLSAAASAVGEVETHQALGKLVIRVR